MNRRTFLQSTLAAGTRLHVTYVGGPPGQGPYIYEFKVPMTVSSPIIPRSTGYNLRIDMYVDNPACTSADQKVMPNLVKIHTSPELRAVT